MKILGFNLFENNSEKAKKLKRVEKFAHIMSIAEKIADLNPLALREFVYALIRPLQSEHILSVVEKADHSGPDSIEYYNFFFSNSDVFSSSKYWLREKPRFELNLACDPILPTTWRHQGFIETLSLIGIGRPCGAWEQSINHSVTLLLPWGIGFVTGGNHSISAGILSGESIPIVANEVIDYRPIFEIVECDGWVYKNKESGEVFSEVTDHRRAAIFEIGRLMIKHDVIRTC